MTDEQIIKALKCCKSAVASCEECPMYVEGVVCHGYELNKKALDLIARQQLEIERLNIENTLTMSERNAFCASFYEVSKQLKTAKSKAVKEFAERLKEKKRELDRFILYDEDIDNLVKEMVGDT